MAGTGRARVRRPDAARGRHRDGRDDGPADPLLPQQEGPAGPRADPAGRVPRDAAEAHRAGRRRGARRPARGPAGHPPADPAGGGGQRIWVSSWDAALADPDLAAGHAARYARSRERLRDHVLAAQRRGELPPGDPDDLAADIQSFTLGLIVQALLGADTYPPERQIHLLDGYLARLAAQPG
ncbi:TetR family transcriptional regulator C-terminal domain-containing protein [Longispora sp. K20-0274]|uniref:TetR family transcriptional regulator C-terminal domain-containing protein n=1 Tax=Longispora sp. K20-0274 TaxID=3088255 RepID=UPI00399A6175